MATTKKQDWELALLDLKNNIFGTVNLQCDGYNVSFQVIKSNMRLRIQWYVDGVWKGIYHNKENEIGQKFGKPMYMKPDKNHVAFLKRFRTKKDLQAYLDGHKEPFAYNHVFDTPVSIIKKLKSTCSDIKLVDN